MFSPRLKTIASQNKTMIEFNWI